jgi:uncharacterized membrane-anchored protein YitT (DUF2179 family)
MKGKDWFGLIFGGVFLAFGLYHVHSLSGVTEGGLLGLNLLLEHWFSVTPAVTNFVFSAICYFIGWKMLGKDFILRSAVAAVAFSLSYRIFEQFPYIYPGLYEMPLLAALLGAVFVGVGTGVCVRCGGAVCGDDALAMAISRKLGIKIEYCYMVSDLLVLGLSLSYIPFRRIAYSLITVFLSSKLVGLTQRKGIDFFRKKR